MRCDRAKLTDRQVGVKTESVAVVAVITVDAVDAVHGAPVAIIDTPSCHSSVSSPRRVEVNTSALAILNPSPALVVLNSTRMAVLC